MPVNPLGIRFDQNGESMFIKSEEFSLKSNPAKRCVKFQHERIHPLSDRRTPAPEMRFQFNPLHLLSLK